MVIELNIKFDALKDARRLTSAITMSKLRFSVAACTSEDAAFPASGLDEHAANSQGYMTAK